jgi:hypothetical protein
MGIVNGDPGIRSRWACGPTLARAAISIPIEVAFNSIVGDSGEINPVCFGAVITVNSQIT